jgi:hypothetical protein
MNYPCLSNRSHFYWIGGAAWATATFMHPEKALSGYVVITREDLDTFAGRLKDGSWNHKPTSMALPADIDAEQQEAIRKKAESERADVMNVFVGEDLQSGVGIMRSVLAASNSSADVIFARNGNYLFGYALSKYNEDKDEATAGAPPTAPAVTRKPAPSKK